MTKKYTLEIFIDEDTGVAFHEEGEELRGSDLRIIMSVFEQIKSLMIHQLNIQSQPIKGKEMKETKAD